MTKSASLTREPFFSLLMIVGKASAFESAIDGSDFELFSLELGFTLALLRQHKFPFSFSSSKSGSDLALTVMMLI